MKTLTKWTWYDRVGITPEGLAAMEDEPCPFCENDPFFEEDAAPCPLCEERKERHSRIVNAGLPGELLTRFLQCLEDSRRH
jgi:hypothetical protein